MSMNITLNMKILKFSMDFNRIEKIQNELNDEEKKNNKECEFYNEYQLSIDSIRFFFRRKYAISTIQLGEIQMKKNKYIYEYCQCM